MKCGIETCNEPAYREVEVMVNDYVDPPITQKLWLCRPHFNKFGLARSLDDMELER